MLEYNLKQTLIKFWNKAKQTFALKTELAQPDWNQNDDTQPDYVNNRTHWEEPEIYNEVFNGENLNYTTSGNLTSYQVNSNIPILSEGRHYELNIGEYNFDGICKKYENVAGSYGYYIGNGSISIQGEPDTGEDFIVYTSGRSLSAPEIMWFIMKNNSPAGEYDTLLALHEGGVHRLDKKFLPDDVVYSDDITQSDWDQNNPEASDYIKNRTHWEIPETVIMNKTFPAPGDGTVFFNLDTPLIAGELYTVSIQGISSGFDTTEEIVAAGDSDGAYLTNSKGLEIGYSVTGFQSGYNAYYTGIGANYGEVVTVTKSGELHRLDKKFLPEDVVYDDDIAQPDWNQNDNTQPDFIKNRTHWTETVHHEELLFEGDVTYQHYNMYTAYGIISNQFTVDSLEDLLRIEVYSDGGRLEKNTSEGYTFYRNNNWWSLYFVSSFGGTPNKLVHDTTNPITPTIHLEIDDNYKDTTHHIVIKKEWDEQIYYTIDEHYIPDTIARQSEIDSLDSTAGIASIQNDIITLKQGIVQTDGLVENNGEQDIELAKVAKTGSYNDLLNKIFVKTDTTNLTQAMNPNTLYVWTNALVEGNILAPTLVAATATDIISEYMGKFTTGATVPTLSFPDNIIWQTGIPTLQPLHTYEFSIMDNIGIFSPMGYVTESEVQTMINANKLKWTVIN